MGLCITGFKHIVLLDADYDEEQEIATDRKTGAIIEVPLVVPWVNSDFPGREDNIIHKKVYSFQEEIKMLHMSYGGYNYWRDELHRLSPVDFELLVNFSDCEGVLGPNTCARLALIFDDNHSKAKDFRSDYPGFLKAYEEMQAGFKLVAHNGLVRFS